MKSIIQNITNIALKRIFIVVIIGINTILISKAQDSLLTLNSEQVLLIVREFHPLVRQTKIGIEKANADILLARSAFDPLISYQSSGKNFSGLNYYQHHAPEIKIPTWYGIEIQGGYEKLTGNRIDPTQTLGTTNYIGINIPLLKNLVLDKRRAILQQSKIFLNMAVVEQKAIMNDLAIHAIEAYWSWVKAYQSFKVAQNNVQISEARFNWIRATYKHGERPAIDTIEALSQLQNFKYQQSVLWLEFQNSGLQLSAYLWKSNNEPYYLPEVVIPQNNWEDETSIRSFNLELNYLLEIASTNHPHLKLYDFKIDYLTIEKRLKFQELLPKVDLKYNMLGKDLEWSKTITNSSPFENNYQYGLKIEIPLRLSQGRSEYKKSQLKIEETELDINQKRYNIQLKVRSYHNELTALKNQIELQSSNYNNCLLLVKAEEIRLNNGESSLFVVNSRENKALEALEKLIDLKTKFYKTIYALQWSAGLLQ